MSLSRSSSKEEVNLRSLSNRLKSIERKLGDDSGAVDVIHVCDARTDIHEETFRISKDGEEIEVLHSKEELIKKYGNNYKVDLSIIVSMIGSKECHEKV
jgi:hypothetical protein